jgi:hypothetical protein
VKPAKNFAVPQKARSQVWEQPVSRLGAQAQRGRKKENSMNFNQLSIIGFFGKNAETKSLANGTPVTKFSVATKRSWKDENDTWQPRTQWHNVIAFGKSFA